MTRMFKTVLETTALKAYFNKNNDKTLKAIKNRF